MTTRCDDVPPAALAPSAMATVRSGSPATWDGSPGPLVSPQDRTQHGHGGEEGKDSVGQAVGLPHGHRSRRVSDNRQQPQPAGRADDGHPDPTPPAPTFRCSGSAQPQKRQRMPAAPTYRAVRSDTSMAGHDCAQQTIRPALAGLAHGRSTPRSLPGRRHPSGRWPPTAPVIQASLNSLSSRCACRHRSTVRSATSRV